MKSKPISVYVRNEHPFWCELLMEAARTAVPVFAEEAAKRLVKRREEKSEPSDGDRHEP